MPKYIRKRDGRLEKFDSKKIEKVVFNALRDAGLPERDAREWSARIREHVVRELRGKDVVDVDEVTDRIERLLLEYSLADYRLAEAAKYFLLARIYNQVYGKGKWKDFDPVDTRHSYTALRVLVSRYLLRDPETGRLRETPKMMYERVAKAVAEAEPPEKREYWAKKFYELMVSGKFLPNSPTLMNAGTGIGLLSACFVIPVRDAIVTADGEGIYDALRAQAIIFQAGGGVGADYSELRPKGDIVRSTGGKSSGPLSFMSLFDKNTDVIKQGGKRRGANMGVMHVWHPDIMDFIKSKTGELKDVHLQNFNISVGVYDRFMDAVENNKKWLLVNPRLTDLEPGSGTSRWYAVTHVYGSLNDPHVADRVVRELEKHGGSISLAESALITWEEFDAVLEYEKISVREVDANTIFEKIVRGAWESGDPGVLFFDTINRRHPVWYLGKITATNPCVSGDTRILTPNGWISARELYEWAKKHTKPVAVAVDNEVLGEGGEPVAYPVQIIVPGGHIATAFIWHVGRKLGMRIWTESGRTITVTYDHKFYVYRDIGYMWLEARDILPWDWVEVADENGNVSMERVATVSGPVEADFYDFTVPFYHTYIGNGFVNHNCGEEPLLPWESCNLGSINLAKYIKGKGRWVRIDWEKLAEDVRVAVRFLDDVITVSRLPLPQLEEAQKRARKIGLGVMGWAHMLIKLGIPYDSVDAVYLAYHLAEWIAFNAYLASIELAKEKGVFPAYDPDLYEAVHVTAPRFEDLVRTALGGYEKPSARIRRIVADRPRVDWKRVENGIKRHGIRNAALLSIAPTGTISIIAGTSSSIEPVFAAAFVRYVTVGTFIEVDPLFRELCEKYRVPPEVVKQVAETGRPATVHRVPPEIRRVFRTALDVHYTFHLLHQASWQAWIDAAVSKTINMPSDATVDDVRDAYMLAWKLGCKGITVYRDKSKSQQVIEFGVKTRPEKKGQPRKMKFRLNEKGIGRARIGEKEYVALDEDSAGDCPHCEL